MTTSSHSFAYALWIEDLLQQGMEPWFVTFMFDELSGSPSEREHQMMQIIERLYGIRVTRVLKHPTAASNHLRRPIWLAAPDVPVFKHLKQTLRVLLVNDGLHAHAIILEPIDRWQSACFAEFAWAEQCLWRRLCPRLARVHVRAITHDVPRVVGYARKQIEQRTDSDGTLILPRANSELRRSSRRIGRQSSIYAPSAPRAKIYRL